MLAEDVKKSEVQNNQGTKDKRLLAFLDKIDDLPVLPPLAIKILEQAKNPDFSIDELIDLIMMDQVLTAKMVKIVNSVYFGLGRKVESLREALVYLGIKEVKNVVLTTTLMNTFSSGKNSKILKSFWQFSFATAVVSKLLAKSIKYKDFERAYLAGLLHDIGEIILIHNFSDDYVKVLQTVEQENCNFEQAENKIFGISHTDFGPWLLEQWNFFGEIAHVVARHHRPETAIYERTLVAIVHLAGVYCQNHDLGLVISEENKIDIEMDYAWEIIRNEHFQDETLDNSIHLGLLDKNLNDIKEIVYNIMT